MWEILAKLYTTSKLNVTFDLFTKRINSVYLLCCVSVVSLKSAALQKRAAGSWDYVMFLHGFCLWICWQLDVFVICDGSYSESASNYLILAWNVKGQVVSDLLWLRAQCTVQQLLFGPINYWGKYLLQESCKANHRQNGQGLSKNFFDYARPSL